MQSPYFSNYFTPIVHEFEWITNKIIRYDSIWVFTCQFYVLYKPFLRNVLEYASQQELRIVFLMENDGDG